MKRKPPQLDKPYRKHRMVTPAEVEVWLHEAEGKPLPEAADTAPENMRISQEALVAKPVPVKRRVKEVTRLDKTSAAKIRSGTTVIQATLDLHGHSRESAYTILVKFITKARARDSRTILVITGKGKPDKVSALREALPAWLSETALREHIIAYDSASYRHGGVGAWYIRLRKRAHDDGN